MIFIYKSTLRLLKCHIEQIMRSLFQGGADAGTLKNGADANTKYELFHAQNTNFSILKQRM